MWRLLRKLRIHALCVPPEPFQVCFTIRMLSRTPVQLGRRTLKTQLQRRVLFILSRTDLPADALSPSVPQAGNAQPWCCPTSAPASQPCAAEPSRGETRGLVRTDSH